MIVANCDQLMVWNSEEFYDLAKANVYTGGLIPSFISDDPEPKHSYIDLSPMHDVKKIYEKKKISNLATVGVYYFQDEADWCWRNPNGQSCAGLFGCRCNCLPSCDRHHD